MSGQLLESSDSPYVHEMRPMKKGVQERLTVGRSAVLLLKLPLNWYNCFHAAVQN